jgi:hypothetical protein
MSQQQRLERRLRISAVLVILGLLVELVSLTWRHPTAFLVFIGVGGLLMATGILSFLYSIVSLRGDPTPTEPGG